MVNVKPVSFFEKQLYNILERSENFDCEYIGGRYAFLKKNGIKFKLEFVCTFAQDKYDALSISCFTPNEGKIDTTVLRFDYVLGKLYTTNPNFRDGIYLHTWKSDGKYDWYVVKPEEMHYNILAKEIDNYVSVFAD